MSLHVIFFSLLQSLFSEDRGQVPSSGAAFPRRCHINRGNTQVQLAGAAHSRLRVLGKLFWYLRAKWTTRSWLDSKAVPSCQLSWADADTSGPGRVQTILVPLWQVSGWQTCCHPMTTGWLMPNLARRFKGTLPEAIFDLPLVISWVRLQSSWTEDSIGSQTYLTGKRLQAHVLGYSLFPTLPWWF